jgi:hypothetical protein
MRVGFAILFAFLTSCIQSDSELAVSSDEASVIGSVSAISERVYAEDWDPRSSEVRWPSEATRMQVIIRSGYEATPTRSATFYAFVVSDGSRLRSVFRVSATEHSQFLSHLNQVFMTAERPGSNRSHVIAGGLWVGPRPSGPIGDPIPDAYINRVLNSAATLDLSARGVIDAAM